MISKLIKQIARFDSHYRLFIALTVSALTFFLIPDRFSFTDPVRLTILWVAFAATILILAWISMLLTHPRDLPKEAHLQDSTRFWMLVILVIAAVASLFAVIALLNAMDKNKEVHLLLPTTAVACAWLLVHTVFTLRYAHLYYGNHIRKTGPPKGLDFPNEDEPDYLDFAYFSFVIGMTSQVSDVAIRAKVMRRTALAHGILSFGFNAIIIALTISGLSK
ncbi:DUF1345 domain-containing protein [Spirosoma harenae]